MKVLITGGLGFIGTQLSAYFLQQGDEVTVVARSREPKQYVPKGVKYVSGDTTLEGSWQEEVPVQDVMINLAGASIFTRWNEKGKRLIYESRVLTTRNLVEALAEGKRTVLCSTSAVGYYGFRVDEELTEENGPGDDFLAGVCVDWEKEARKAEAKGARVVIARFGLVLGKTGGVLGEMIPLFKRFIGGPLGSGCQWVSWIHMKDLLRAMSFVIEKREIHGPVNFCSPDPVKNEEFANGLGKVLRRPSFFRAPAFMIRLVLGEFGSFMLKGQRVLPTVLLKHGYRFRYPEIEKALSEVVGTD